jgi:glycerate-2-kinase
MSAPRHLLRRLFEVAVAAADPTVCLARHLPSPPRGRTIVVGAGGQGSRPPKSLSRRWLTDAGPFYAVGEHYDDFTQTSDQEVIMLLDDARSWKREEVR